MRDSMIPLSRQLIDEEMKTSVIEALESGSYILGERSRKFESMFKDFIGVKHGLLSNSATSSLMLGLRSIDITSGEIIVPSHTAFATIEPIIHSGAKPVFVDIDPETYTIDPEKIQEKITDKTKAIIPVHLYGHPCDMDRIMEIAEKNSIDVIEDCSQAHGSEYKTKKVGSNGRFSIFSFFPSKNLSVCGDGGIVVTNDDDVAKKIKMLRDHGRNSKYSNDMFGYNMRFNEIQAAIGLINLDRLDDNNNKRRRVAKIYNQELGGLDFVLPVEKEWGKHVYHMFVIRTTERDKFTEFLKQNSIGFGVHYPIPCHLQPAVLNMFGRVRLENTEKAIKEIVSIPMSPHMTQEDVDQVCSKIKQFS